jgi:hypothetical protein
MHTPLKQILLVSLASVTLLGACKKGNDAAAKMKEFSDKMCACADKKGEGDCAKKITDEMTKWSADNAGKGETAAKATDEEAAATKRFTDCATKAMMAGMGGGSGAMAGGSGGTMAGGSGGTMAGGSGDTMGGSAAPASSVKDIASADDYKARNEAMLAKFKDAFGQSDCDKAAAALGPLIDANKDEITAIRTYEKAHPEEENKFDDAHKDAEKPMMATADKCNSNAAFHAAMDKMPQ